MTSVPAIPQPPTQADLLEVFRRSVAPEYYAAVVDHPSFAMFRGLAAQWSALAQKGVSTLQARFHLPHSLQLADPATGAARATGTVVLRRTASTELELIYEVGTLRIEIAGRTYRNAAQVRWGPGDSDARSVLFACEIPGACGNLDHLGATIDTTLVAWVDRARDRAGTSGTILADGRARDTGVPDVFDADDLGLYLRVAASGVSSNVGQTRRVLGFDDPSDEIPLGSALYPRVVALDTQVGSSASEVLVDNGGVIADYYNEARNGGVIPILPTPLTVNDAFYLGLNLPFDAARVTLSVAGRYTGTIAWEYWNGAAWTDLDIDDPGDAWRPAVAGEILLRWTRPLDWAATTAPSPTGASLYYVRARLATWSATVTVPVASRAVVYRNSVLTADAGSMTWQLLGPEDLGVTISEVGSISGGCDANLDLLGDERGIRRAAGESDSQYRQRVARLADVVSPNAILRTVNQALAPYGFRGNAMDVGNGITGFFLDIPSDMPELGGALDLYEPGDAYPVDPWILPLDHDEAYGWFIVTVPYLPTGEFGNALDDGPVYQLDGGWAAPAGEHFVLDGYPVGADALYSSIYSQVDAIRMGGVRFMLVRDASIEADAC